VQVPVYSLTGEVMEKIEISDQVFAVPFNEGVVHQVMVGQLANARQGTASTKTRSEVEGSSRKMFRQKGTGLARAGSRRASTRRGGGIIFGPKPRDYHQNTPKKMRRLALKCVLSAKVKDNELKVVQELKLEPKTKYMAQFLDALGADSSALVVTASPEEHVIKAARNIKGIKTIPANLLNVPDILSHKALLMTVSSVRRAEELWGEKTAVEVKDAPV
jgi:large subunit ribosomal protein L4